MEIKDLSRKYAKEFCQENLPVNIKERSSASVYSIKGDVVIRNGEYILGPLEAWPNQLNNLTKSVSRRYFDKEVNYETLSRILLNEVEEVRDRQYVSKEEYYKTVESLFNSIILGMRIGRLEGDYDQRLRDEKNKYSKIGWLFKKSKVEKRIKEDLEKRLQKIINSSENYNDSVMPYFLREVA